MGRPLKQIDETLLEKLAAIHCTMEEMALIFNCSVDTLSNRYSDLIKSAKAEGKSSLRRLQWAQAQKGNTAMLIWLGKQLLGQRDMKDVVMNAEIKTNESQIKEELEAFKAQLSEKA